MDLALIGNCSYQALVDERATIRWLCWPRFDSDFVFGSLLDDRAGHFSVHYEDEALTSEQSYIGHTNVLRTKIGSQSGHFEVIDFAPRFLQDDRIYRPTILVRILRPLEGKPRVRIDCAPTGDYGRRHPSGEIAGSRAQWQLGDCRLHLITDAPLAPGDAEHAFPLERPTYMVLGWDKATEGPLATTCENYLSRTIEYWQQWANRTSVPERYQEEVIRSALVLKLHQYEATGAITAAATTSVPEYPGSGRNWDYRYCWLRDAAFTVAALYRVGHVDEMTAFLDFVRGLIPREQGRLQPLYGVAGESSLEESVLDHLDGYQGSGPVRVGNAAYRQEQHDVYGELLAALCPLYLEEPTAETWDLGLVDYLLTQIEENLERPDAGLWEKRDTPQLYTFSLLMHWAGARAAIQIAAAHNLDALGGRAGEVAERARELIETRCWRARPGFFAESTSNDDADASLLMMIHLGFLHADDPRAKAHLDTVVSRLRVNDHLLHRYTHDDGLGPTHAAFTVCGFWHAEALARTGRRQEGERIYERLLQCGNHVGLLSEDIDPHSGRMWGNFPQTYSHVGVINTALAISSSRNQGDEIP